MEANQKVEYAQLANHEKRQFVKVEEQGHTLRIAVRFFQLKKPVTEQHSYIVGIEMGGLSQEISTVVEVGRSASFKELRVAIEVKKDRGMVRRTITFQALRHLMEVCSNPHGYDDKRRYAQNCYVPCLCALCRSKVKTIAGCCAGRRTEYRMGFMDSEDDDVPTLFTRCLLYTSPSPRDRG